MPDLKPVEQMSDDEISVELGERLNWAGLEYANSITSSFWALERMRERGWEPTFSGVGKDRWHVWLWRDGHPDHECIASSITRAIAGAVLLALRAEGAKNAE